LQEEAQKQLDEAMTTRTTSDITNIVQKLFKREEGQLDLCPIRDQGGAYFVPHEAEVFVDKVEMFLEKLGGYVRRLPIYGGTKKGDAAVQDIVSDAMAQLVDDHRQAVTKFTINTQRGTIESAAAKIQETRVKIEAYAHYLQARKDDLMKEVDEAKDALQKQVAEIAGQRKSMPAVDKNSKLVFGHPVTAVIRYLGKEGWAFTEAKAVLEEMKVSVADGTIKTQLGWGKRGGKVCADLGEKAAKRLETLRKKVTK